MRDKGICEHKDIDTNIVMPSLPCHLCLWLWLAVSTLYLSYLTTNADKTEIESYDKEYFHASLS